MCIVQIWLGYLIDETCESAKMKPKHKHFLGVIVIVQRNQYNCFEYLSCEYSDN